MIYCCLLLSPLLHIDSIESGTKFLYIIYWNIMDGGTNANCHFPINIFLFAPLSCLLSNIWVISSVNRSIIQRKSTTEPESEPYFPNTITSRTNITVRLKKKHLSPLISSVNPYTSNPFKLWTKICWNLFIDHQLNVACHPDTLAWTLFDGWYVFHHCNGKI